MVRKLIAIIMLCAACLAVDLPCHADVDDNAIKVLGPIRFERGHGKPTTETVTFSSRQTGTGFLMRVQNGDDQGNRRVSSGTLILNGNEVIGPSDFNQDVEEIEREVTLSASNELAVTLASTSGSFIVITIFGAPSTDLDVTFTATPATIEAGQAATLSWISTGADSCSIDQGIGNVPLSGSMRVSPTQTTTYTITAVGAAGSVSKSITVAVTHPQVSVSLSVAPETLQAGQSAVLTWSTTNADGCVIEPGIGAVGPSGSISVSPTETTTYTITATGAGGTAAASVTIKVVQHVSISITRPTGGESISRPDILVEGVITNPSGLQLGITVNGVAATLYEDRFVANHVPLVEGPNTITATAMDMEGEVREASIVVFAETPGNTITLTAAIPEGLSPLETLLVVDGTVSFSQPPSITDSGPGKVVITAEETPQRMNASMQTEGIYHLTASVEDSLGNLLTDTIAVVVQDRSRMDALFRFQWSGMLACLNEGNVQGALSYFTDTSRDKYGRLFNVLQDRLPAVASRLTDIEIVYLHDRVARYRLKKDEEIQGQIRTISHCIYFVKDNSGLWRISEF